MRLGRSKWGDASRFVLENLLTRRAYKGQFPGGKGPIAGFFLYLNLISHFLAHDTRDCSYDDVQHDV